jgi:MFS family permease
MLASQPPDPPELPVNPEPPGEQHDPYAALRNSNYLQYFIGNAFSVLGMQMAGVAIGWELYGLTHSTTALGLVGLVQIIPIVLFALPAGNIVDRFNRKHLIMLVSFLVMVLFILMGLSSVFSSSFANLPLFDFLNAGLNRIAGEPGAQFIDPHVPILLFLLLLIGMLRAVNQPAKQSIMPMLVEPKDFPNAVTWSSSLFEICNMVGPTMAGVAIGLFQKNTDTVRGTWVFAGIYWTNALFQGIQLINFSFIRLLHSARAREPMTRKSLLAGVHFVTRNKIILSTLTLDLFAVLLGGATALLPVFAKDVLHVGAVGFGMLRAAPSVGAFSMAMFLAHRPPMKHAGRNLLWAVIGFGIATIVFGASHYFLLSLVALLFTGIFDNISVVVRHTLVQLLTPDAMRGRVNAVNSVFISCSNELGAFESGIAATYLGTMSSVVLGGIATIVSVGAVVTAWPQILKVKRLEDQHPIESQT